MANNGVWSDEKKIEVVTAYLALGKAPMVEAVTGVPAGTIRKWRMEDWWKEIEGLLRDENGLELNSKLAKIVNKSLDLVLDRIENGELRLTEDGKAKRVPVALRDAARVANDTIDRQALIAKVLSPAKSEQVSLDSQIKKLAEEFAKFVKGAPDGTELQGRVSEVPLQAGADQEQGGAQCGALSDGGEGGARHQAGCGPQEADLEGREEQSFKPSNPV